MVDRLRHAVNRVAQAAEKLSEDEQNTIAAQLETIANDLRWEDLLSDPTRTPMIDALADEALAELQAGKTHALSDVFRDHEL